MQSQVPRRNQDFARCDASFDNLTLDFDDVSIAGWCFEVGCLERFGDKLAMGKLQSRGDVSDFIRPTEHLAAKEVPAVIQMFGTDYIGVR
jgi:hypothetical protein